MWDTIKSAVGGWIAKAAGKLVPIMQYIPAPFNALWGNINSRRLLDYYVGWAYACIRAIAEEVGTIKLHLYKVNSKGEMIELDSHPLLDLLNRPNPNMTKADLFEATASFLEMQGDSFWFLSRLNEGKGKIAAIYPIRPDATNLIINSNAEVTGYRYFTSNESYNLGINEVFHIKTFNPKDPFRGIGTLQAALPSVVADVQAEQWNNRFFENGANPDVVLEYPTSIKPEEKQRIMDTWQQEFAGARNAGKTPIMAGGMKLHLMTRYQKDMDFVALREFSRDQIMAIFRVPPIILMMSQDFNRATAEAALESFSRFKIKPSMQKVVDYLNEFLVPEFGDDLILGFDDPVPENRELKLKSYETGFGRYLTINDIRAAEGLDPIGEEGDSVLVPLNYVSAGQPTKQVNESAYKIQRKGVILASRKGLRSETPDAEEIVDDVVSKAVGNSYAKLNKEAIGEAFWKGMIGRTDSYEKLYISNLHKYFDAQEKQIIGVVEAQVKSAKKDIGGDDLVNIDKEVEILVKQFTPIYWEIVKSEGQEGLDFIGSDIEFDTTTEYAKSLVYDNVKKFAKQISETSQKELAQLIADGIANGMGADKLTKAITEKFAQYNTTRAHMIARSEVIRATNASHVAGWKQSGVVEAKEWYTALDERVCAYCNDMQGKIFGLDDTIFSEGETLKVGDQSMTFDYGDVEEPPLHAQCRCTVLPVLYNVETEKAEKPKVKRKQKAPSAATSIPRFEVDRLREEMKAETSEELRKLRETVEDALIEADGQEQEESIRENTPTS